MACRSRRRPARGAMSPRWPTHARCRPEGAQPSARRRWHSSTIGTAMDTSSPPPDAPPAPREAALTTMADQVAAIDEIVGYARTRLQVFDVDMSAGGWHRAARLESLGRFLRGSRTARCEIILHELRWLESA